LKKRAASQTNIYAMKNEEEEKVKFPKDLLSPEEEESLLTPDSNSVSSREE